MAQTNSVGQGTNGVTDESPNMIVYRKVRDIQSPDAIGGVCVTHAGLNLSEIDLIYVVVLCL